MVGGDEVHRSILGCVMTQPFITPEIIAAMRRCASSRNAEGHKLTLAINGNQAFASILQGAADECFADVDMIDRFIEQYANLNGELK